MNSFSLIVSFPRQAGTACGLKVLFCDGHDVFFVGGISLFFGFAHTKRAARRFSASFCSFVFLYFPCLNYTFL